MPYRQSTHPRQHASFCRIALRYRTVAPEDSAICFPDDTLITDARQRRRKNCRSHSRAWSTGIHHSSLIPRSDIKLHTTEIVNETSGTRRNRRHLCRKHSELVLAAVTLPVRCRSIAGLKIVRPIRHGFPVQVYQRASVDKRRTQSSLQHRTTLHNTASHHTATH